MASISVLNSKADVLRHSAAIDANVNAAEKLLDLLKSNLGPKGTLKMLIGGAGQIKITKDGNVLLHEMHIRHPTASMIARASVAQDNITGDGTTSNVLIIGELLKQCQRYVKEGVHPRILCDGIDLARQRTCEILDSSSRKIDITDRETLTCVARSSLRTKLEPDMADHLTGICVDAVNLVQREGEPIDLHMVEVMHIKEKLINDTELVRGMVMDHGGRHAAMPKRLSRCHILTCNVSLEYEKTEVNSGFFYSSAEQRDRMVHAERKFVEQKVQKILDLKEQVCMKGESFCVLNMKGIDPGSLDMFAKNGILALRRVKRRNMERLALCCGGEAVNSVEDLAASVLGFAENVWEEQHGEDKFTFLDGVRNPKSCCILIRGSSDHAIAQIKDAVRDGLRAVNNAIFDKTVVCGAGAFEASAHVILQEYARKEVQGKKKYGVRAFADALMIIPKTLALNSGFDIQDTILTLLEKHEQGDSAAGLDVETGGTLDATVEGIYDNYCVKRQLLSIAPTLAQQLLLVDEIVRGGKSMGRGQ